MHFSATQHCLEHIWPRATIHTLSVKECIVFSACYAKPSLVHCLATRHFCASCLPCSLLSLRLRHHRASFTVWSPLHDAAHYATLCKAITTPRLCTQGGRHSPLTCVLLRCLQHSVTRLLPAQTVAPSHVPMLLDKCGHCTACRSISSQSTPSAWGFYRSSHHSPCEAEPPMPPYDMTLLA